MSFTPLRARIAAWLSRVLKHTGWTQDQLANEAGISGSAISRALNPKLDYVFGPKLIDRVMTTTGLPGPFEDADAAFRQDETVPLDLPPDHAEALKAALAPDVTPLDLWQVTAPSLEDAGYVPGDMVLVAPGAEPQPGDAVIATIRDFERNADRIVLRLYHPPYLVTATHHCHGTEVIPANAAAVTGVIVATARTRQPTAA